MTPRRAERWLVSSLVLAFHVALLWAWRGAPQASDRREARRPAQAPLVVRLVRSETTTEVPPPVPPQRAAAHTAERTPPRAAKPVPLPPEAAATIAPATTTVTSSPEPAASTADHRAEPALDLRVALPRGRAERGTLTEVPGSARHQALNDPRSNTRTDPTQKLPDDIATAGKGDCLKGEYATPFSGLLALPFLAYAAAAGHCKPQR